MEEKKTEQIKPSFFKLIIWACSAVGFTYLITLLPDGKWWKLLNICLTFCSVWCAIVAIAEAYLIHAGQDAINKLSDEE